MRSKFKHIASGLALGAAAVAFMPQLAFAQGADEGDGFNDGEIVVEARRKEESVQDVPLVVNAVSQDTLNKLQIRNFADIATIVPGLLLSSNANGIGSKSSVRGVNFDVNASGNNGTIEYYFNDSPLSAGILFTATYDLGQIEVLRGPQGTLRGRASPSGSITVTSRRPDLGEIGGYASGTVATHDAYNVQGGFNLPIVQDVLAIRVAGVYDHTNAGGVRSINNPTDPYARTWSGRVSVRAKPFGDVLTLDGTYQHVDRKSVSFAQQEYWGFVASQFGQTWSPNTTCAGEVCYLGNTAAEQLTAKDRLSVHQQTSNARQTFNVWNWSAQLRFAGQRLSYVGSRSTQHLLSGASGDAGQIFLHDEAPAAYTYLKQSSAGSTIGSGAAYVGGTPTTMLPFRQETNTRARQSAHELRLQNDERLAGIFDYVVGYFRNRLNPPTNLISVSPNVATKAGNPIPAVIGVSGTVDPSGATYVPPLGQPGRMGFTFVSRRGHSAEDSFFANLTVHLTDSTEISGGVRQITYKNWGCTGVNAFATNLSESNFAGCTEVQDTHENATIYAASIKHRFNDNLMVYASTGTSWRPGPRVVYISGIGTTACDPALLAASTAPVNGCSTQSNYLNLPSERSESYELGFKSDWFDKRLTVNISGYYQKYANYPYRNVSGITTVNYSSLVATGAAAGSGANAAFSRISGQSFVTAIPVKVHGIEFEFSARPIDGLSISGNVNYALGKASDIKVPCNDYYKIVGGAFTLGSDGIADGNQTASNALPTYTASNINTATAGSGVNVCGISKIRTALSSPWSAVLQAEYSRPVSGNMDGFIRGLLTWNGDSQNDPLNRYDDVASYGLLNMYLGVRDRDGAWDVTLYGKNITNTFRVTNRQDGPGTTSYAGASFAGNYAVGTDNGSYTSAPREFGVTARFAFGAR